MQGVPFGGSVDIPPHVGSQILQNPNISQILKSKIVASCHFEISKKRHCSCLTDFSFILHNYLSWPFKPHLPIKF